MEHEIVLNPDLFPLKKGVFIVGGTIRDILLGQAPKDFDIAVAGDPKLFSEKLAHRLSSRPILMGHPGRETIRIVSEKIVYDIVRLNGATIADDVKNRDFTINAMAYSLSDNRLIDPLRGRDDLRNGIIRMVSEESLINDPVRMLRAFRLGAALGFVIEPKTLERIQYHRFLMTGSAAERIKAELFKLFQNRRSFPYLRQMASTGILFEIFPVLKDLVGCPQNEHHAFDVFNHTLSAYQRLEVFFDTLSETVPETVIPVLKHLNSKKQGLLKYALLLHDIGKPETASRDVNGAIHFYGHGKESASMAWTIGKALRLSVAEMNYVDNLIRHHNRPRHLFALYRKNQLTPKALVRFFLQCGPDIPDILVHAIADHCGKGLAQNNGFVEFALQTALNFSTGFELKKSEKPLVTGFDLIDSFGLTPSPVFRIILRHIEEARLSGEIQTRDQAFSWVNMFLAGRTDSNA
jgi:poly(A) polymerase